MLDRVLADIVLATHLGFILFAVFGGLLALRWRWIPVLHLPAVVWGVSIELSGGTCPLTPIENSLRHAAGSSGYSTSFIEHYLLPVIYPAAMSPLVHHALAALLVAANLGAYLIVLRRRRQRARARSA